MGNLYFDCTNGISGDMAVAALLDFGASREKLDIALSSMNLENEFTYKITEKTVNSIKATDFDVILPEHQNKSEEHGENHCKHHHHGEHHHHHRNLEDVNKIIEKAEMTDGAKALAKKIFKIVAVAESKVHNKPINEVHFHELGAIDSIVDIVSFSVLYDDINPDKTYFTTLTEGRGHVKCQHGVMNVPVPAVLEILSEYKIPIKISDNEGEMITPTGAAIVAALFKGENLPDKIIIKKTGRGAGKRPYKNPIVQVIEIDE